MEKAEAIYSAEIEQTVKHCLIKSKRGLICLVFSTWN